ncbi:MAG: rhodanese-like domain-containing protein, partial [Phycisphaerales bacterium]|nr:rhodanese-like domain-containing protein [Phycisphaerales bacterium]
MKTLQQVLAIVGGAFLIGTVQAMIFGPVTLGPANLTIGTQNSKGDPTRGGKIVETTPAEPADEPADEQIDEQIDEPVVNPLDGVPVASYTGAAADSLLDAPVPEGSLTLREAKELWDLGVYFIDARHEYEFDAGHIKYAAFLESKLFDTDIERANAVMDSIPMDGTIVLYCVGGEC